MNTPQRLSRYSHFIAKIFERFLAQDTILNGTCWITRSIDILFFSFFFLDLIIITSESCHRVCYRKEYIYKYKCIKRKIKKIEVSTSDLGRVSLFTIDRYTVYVQIVQSRSHGRRVASNRIYIIYINHIFLG